MLRALIEEGEELKDTLRVNALHDALDAIDPPDEPQPAGATSTGGVQCTRLALAAAFLALAAGGASGQQPAASAAADRPACEADALDCAKYWTAPSCELSVYIQVDDDGDAPVTEDRLKNAVESRLRGALILYDGRWNEWQPSLHVWVRTVTARVNGAAFGASLLNIDFSKRRTDAASGVTQKRSGRVRTEVFLHTQNLAEQRVMNAVSAALDQIINDINDYLRVNEPACGERGR